MSDEHTPSYAEAVASGPQQSAEEARANPVDEVIPTDQSIESLIDVTTGVAVVPSDFKEQEIKTETQAARVEAEQQAAEEAEEQAVEEAAIKAEDEAKKTRAAKKEDKKEAAKAYAENPIVAANGIAITVVSLALGIGAYRKHQAGQLTWKLAGMWGAGVAAFAGADYVVSKYLWTQYPPSQKK